MLKPSDHWQIRALFILYLLWLPLNLWALSSYPAPDSDEAWFASPALALRQTNQLTIPIFGDTTGMLQSQTLWRGYSAGLAVWTQVVGFGLVQARMFSLLPVALTGLLLFWFGRRTIHAQAGIFAAAFYLLSLRVFPASHFARPDTWVQFLGVASWVAFWKLVTTPKLAAVWVFAFGCLVTASADLYPLVLYFTAASGSAFGLFCIYNKKWAWLGWFILGCSVGTAYYLALRFLPNPLQTWQEMHSVQSFYESNVPKPNDWQAISDYFTAFLIPFVLKQGILGHSRLAPIEFLLGSVGLSVLCVQHSNRNNFLLWSGLCLWVGFLLPYKGLHHLVEFTPWVSLLCTVGVFGLGGLWRVGMRRFEPPNWLKRYAGGWSSSKWALAYSLPFWLVSFAAAFFLAYRSQPLQLATTAHNIQAYLPSQPTSILAEGTWWWFLPARQFTSDEYLRLYQQSHPNQSATEIVDQVLTARTIEVLLLDENFSHFEMETNPAMQQALRDYAQAHCQLQGSVTAPGYGVEVGGPFPKKTDVFWCQ